VCSNYGICTFAINVKLILAINISNSFTLSSDKMSKLEMEKVIPVSGEHSRVDQSADWKREEEGRREVSGAREKD
jgi:hypothetical protein